MSNYPTSGSPRFWSKVDIRGHDECWPWLAFKDRNGYGKYKDGDQMMVASRVAWELVNMEELEGRMACHTCDNPSCCNPRHIYAGDAKVNAEDAARRNRLIPGDHSGEKNSQAKLTWPEVRQIRKALRMGEDPWTLSFEYNVSEATIRGIRDGRTWKEGTEQKQKSET